MISCIILFQALGLDLAPDLSRHLMEGTGTIPGNTKTTAVTTVVTTVDTAGPITTVHVDVAFSHGAATREVGAMATMGTDPTTGRTNGVNSLTSRIRTAPGEDALAPVHALPEGVRGARARAAGLATLTAPRRSDPVAPPLPLLHVPPLPRPSAAPRRRKREPPRRRGLRHQTMPVRSCAPLWSSARRCHRALRLGLLASAPPLGKASALHPLARAHQGLWLACLVLGSSQRRTRRQEKRLPSPLPLRSMSHLPLNVLFFCLISFSYLRCLLSAGL